MGSFNGVYHRFLLSLDKRVSQPSIDGLYFHRCLVRGSLLRSLLKKGQRKSEYDQVSLWTVGNRNEVRDTVRSVPEEGTQIQTQRREKKFL